MLGVRILEQRAFVKLKYEVSAFYKASTRFAQRSYAVVALILVERSLLPCSVEGTDFE